MSKEMSEKRYPLQGLRVMDFTQFLSGPLCTMMLADYGAEVVQVEPLTGTAYRTAGMSVETEKGKRTDNFLRFNRSKKSIAVNLKNPEGQEIIKKLLPHFDVLVANFRPGIMEKFGLGWEEVHKINDRLIYATINGFGDPSVLESPYGSRPAFSIIAEAMGGMVDMIGPKDGPPAPFALSIADTSTGIMAFAGISMALYEREKTGKGRRVDAAMMDTSMVFDDMAIARYGSLGQSMTRGAWDHMSPWGQYPAKDGYICITIMLEKQWINLCKAIGHPELATNPELADGKLRNKNYDTMIKQYLEGWTTQRTKKEVQEILTAHDVPVALVQNVADLFEDPNVKAHKMIIEVEDQVIGKFKVVGMPIKMNGIIEPETYSPSLLGEHTDELLTDLLGMKMEDINKLRESDFIK